MRLFPLRVTLSGSSVSDGLGVGSLDLEKDLNSSSPSLSLILEIVLVRVLTKSTGNGADCARFAALAARMICSGSCWIPRLELSANAELEVCLREAVLTSSWWF